MMKRKLCFLLALLMMGMTACGDTGSATTDETTTSGDTTTAAPEGYDYGDYDFGGHEFNVLTFDEYCKCFIYLDFEDQTGEILEDAVWERNTKVEDELNITITEIKEPYTSWTAAQQGLVDKVVQSVMAGDNTYDAAMLPISFKPAAITDGYLEDLNQLPGLNVKEDYWDTVINESLELNGKLFCASSFYDLCTMELCDVLLFNEDLFDELKLEYPYDMVRDGTWTLDAWISMIKTATNLNGDESFTFSEGGNAIYGTAGHTDMPIAYSYGAGNRLATLENGELKLGIETERFYDTVEKLMVIFDQTSGHILTDNVETRASGYTNLFRSGRAAFITCELKSAVVLRDMEQSFGLLPTPKYDKNQEDYYTAVSYNSLFITVPKGQENRERTGVILDALSYESNEIVLPAYYDVTVSQKGLRNEDSIEMLEIVNNSRGIEFTQMFGVTTSYVSALNSAIRSGTAAPASLAASHKDAINTSMQKVIEAIDGLE